VYQRKTKMKEIEIVNEITNDDYLKLQDVEKKCKKNKQTSDENVATICDVLKAPETFPECVDWWNLFYMQWDEKNPSLDEFLTKHDILVTDEEQKIVEELLDTYKIYNDVINDSHENVNNIINPKNGFVGDVVIGHIEFFSGGNITLAEFLKYLGIKHEDENKHTTISLDKITYNKFSKYCKENGYSVAGLIRKLMLEQVSHHT